MMQEYVLGFCFSNSLEEVWLIRKKRPAWQAGKLNGVGGHVEEGETPLCAMLRESFEEFGHADYNWQKFGEYTCACPKPGRVYLFRGIERTEYPRPVMKTDEEPVLSLVESIALSPLKPRFKPTVMSNLAWLVPMALEASAGVQYIVDETERKEKNDA